MRRSGLAQQYQLPVVLHVRRSADRLLKYLRRYKYTLDWYCPCV
jgi:Tat protein secretion system quality control protein TatD with DNase activity